MPRKLECVYCHKVTDSDHLNRHLQSQECLKLQPPEIREQNEVKKNGKKVKCEWCSILVDKNHLKRHQNSAQCKRSQPEEIKYDCSPEEKQGHLKYLRLCGIDTKIMKENKKCEKTIHFCEDWTNNKSCSTCYNRCFISHSKAQFLKNAIANPPYKIHISCHDKLDFICGFCQYEFSTPPHQISVGSWCNHCGGSELCNKECQMCENHSLASLPEVAKYFNIERNQITPRQVCKSSHYEYFFDCDKCGHCFEIALTEVNRGSWCNFCYGQNLCDDEKCQWCYEKSFASCPKADYWDYKENKNSPRQVRKRSDLKCIFNCDQCDKKLKLRLADVAEGHWCSSCSRRKTEQDLHKTLDAFFGKDRVISQFSPSWCRNPKTKKILPLDFKIDNIIIELDGGQHFREIKNWRRKVSLKSRHSRDIFKMHQALINNYQIVRISQECFYDKPEEMWPQIQATLIKLFFNKNDKITYLSLDDRYKDWPLTVDEKSYNIEEIND